MSGIFFFDFPSLIPIMGENAIRTRNEVHNCSTFPSSREGGGKSKDDVGEGVKKDVIVLLYHLFSTGDEKVDLFLQKKTQQCQQFIYCILIYMTDEEG